MDVGGNHITVGEGVIDGAGVSVGVGEIMVGELHAASINPINMEKCIRSNRIPNLFELSLKIILIKFFT